MLDGLLPGTCLLVADKLRAGPGGYRLLDFDLIEYGCANGQRRELRRRHFDDSGPGFAIDREGLEAVLRQVNYDLRQRSHCDCV